MDKLDEQFLWDIANKVEELLVNHANRKVFERYANEFHREWLLYKETMMQWGEKTKECRERASKDEKWRNEENGPPETGYEWDYYHCCWMPPPPILPTLRLKVGHGGIVPKDATENLKRSYLWLIIIHDAELQQCVSPVDKNSEPLAMHIGIFEGNLAIHNKHVLLSSETHSGRRLIETALTEVKSDLASTKAAETEQKKIPLLLPSCRDIKDYVDQIETPRELLDFLQDEYKPIYDSGNFGKEPSFFSIIRKAAIRIRGKDLSLNLPQLPINDDIETYEDWCISAEKCWHKTMEQQLAVQIINDLNEWMSVGSIENWLNRGLVFEERYKQIFCENAPKEYHPNHYLEFRLSIRNKLWMDSIILKLKAKGKDGLAEDIEQRQNKFIAEVSTIDKNLEPTNLMHLPNLQLNSSAARLRNALEAALPCLGEQADLASTKQKNEQTISQLIAQGECHTIEFKETLEYDIKTNNNSKDVLLSSLKTIAGFLNADGGTLLIGVNDSGKTKGIKRDLSTMKHGNNDRFEQKIRNYLRDRFNPQPIGEVKISFEKFAEGTICRVDVSANKDIIHLDGDIYVRDGNTTQKPEGRHRTDWIQQRDK